MEIAMDETTVEYTFERWAVVLGTETVTFTVPAKDLPEGFDELTDDEKTDMLFDQFTHDLEMQRWEFVDKETVESGPWEQYD